jgi:hypothetical protein
MYTKHAIAAFAGALLGLSLSFVPASKGYIPGAFLATVFGSWVGIGLYAVASGEVNLAGRGGRGARTTVGFKARVIGGLIIVTVVAFLIVARYAER